ncbi:MAG: tetratricopeptide repeat protein [Desulfobacterales bacterium]|nr:MAG: tetratricopeptide repeat protein [Desulfobacterales bacterium]
MAVHHMAIKMFDKGVAAYVRNKHTKSIQLFSRALKYDPKFELGYLSRGAANLKLGNVKKAMNDFNHVIKLNPNSARAYHFRGLTFERRNDIARAYQDFDRALEIDPDYAAAYHSRNSLLSKEGHTDFSIEELDIINHLMAMRVSRFDEDEQSGDLAA